MKKLFIGFILFASPTAFSQEHAIDSWTSPNGTVWHNIYRGSNGKIWSDILPWRYLNCNQKGNANKGVCIRDAITDKLIGADEVNRQILTSEAISACNAIGGRLPSMQDVENETGYDSSRQTEVRYLIGLGSTFGFATATLESNSDFHKTYGGYDCGNCTGRSERNNGSSIRCVAN